MNECENDKNWFEMTIIDIHQEYQMPIHRNVHIRLCWDGWDVETHLGYFIELFYPDRPKAKPYQHISDDELMQIMKRSWFTEPNILPDPVDPIDYPQCALHRITGHIDSLHEWADIFAKSLIVYAYDVGGDDDYYDYYPSFVKMFYYVCRNLDLPDLYKSTYDKMIDALCADRDRQDVIDDDNFPIWTD